MIHVYHIQHDRSTQALNAALGLRLLIQAAEDSTEGVAALSAAYEEILSGQHPLLSASYVADVRTQEPEIAFQLTNSINASWSAAPAAGVIPKGQRQRSTSVCDFMLRSPAGATAPGAMSDPLKAGEMLVVAPMGWIQFERQADSHEAQAATDWYTRRNELEPGQVFKCLGGVVMLDSRVAGDGTKWNVLEWHDGWCCYGTEIEPGDLEGEPVPDNKAAIDAALAVVDGRDQQGARESAGRRARMSA